MCCLPGHSWQVNHLPTQKCVWMLAHLAHQLHSEAVSQFRPLSLATVIQNVPVGPRQQSLQDLAPEVPGPTLPFLLTKTVT